MEDKQNKKIVRIQKYTVQVTHFDDNTVSMSRTNDGFNVIELLGILHQASLDVNDQIKDKMSKPDVVKRTVIID